MRDFISRSGGFLFFARALFSLLALGAMLHPAAAAGEPPEKPERIAIREFDIDTLGRLGREIHLHDELAWRATDVVLGQVGVDRLQKEGGRGWIVDVSNRKALLVRFLRLGHSGSEALYDVTFVKGVAPALSTPENRELTPAQRAAAEALETAKAKFMTANLPWCGGNPNTVVLGDPDGSGFLVYFLRAKESADQIPVGGHYRFTVSADGKSVEQVDKLFASCLTVGRAQVPKGSTPVGMMMSHIISATPLETHVFLSLQEGLPFIVSTPDRSLWNVEKGTITRTGSLDDVKKQNAPKNKPTKAK